MENSKSTSEKKQISIKIWNLPILHLFETKAYLMGTVAVCTYFGYKDVAVKMKDARALLRFQSSLVSAAATFDWSGSKFAGGVKNTLHFFKGFDISFSQNLVITELFEDDTSFW